MFVYKYDSFVHYSADDSNSKYSTFNCAHRVLPDLSTGSYVTNRVQVGQFWVLLVSMQSSITPAPGYEKLFYVLNICFLIFLGKKVANLCHHIATKLILVFGHLICSNPPICPTVYIFAFLNQSRVTLITLYTFEHISVCVTVNLLVFHLYV